MQMTRWGLCARAGMWIMTSAALAACGGGTSSPPPVPATPPLVVQLSDKSPVADACTGGRTAGALHTHAEVEPTFAVDRRSGLRRIAAWQQDRWSNGGARALVSAASADGGVTWQQVLHPMSRCGGAAPGSSGDFERATDPWLDFAPDGTAYLMGLATSGALLTDGSSSAMLVSRSTDGGLSWSAPLTLIRDFGVFHNDKNTLSADPLDARRVYAVWSRLDRAGGSTTMFARTTDGGATWEPARVIVAPQPAGGAAGRSKTIGNRIVVVEDGAARGALVNVFTQTDVVDGVTSRRVAVVTSFDQGASWEAPVVVAALRSVGTRDAASGARVRDGNILPAAAAGPDGSVWVAWQDARFNGGTRDAILVSRSTDAGRSWSAPVAVNREPLAAAFTPAVHVRADGRVGVLHFDLRRDTPAADTLWADAWLVSSSDGVDWTETHVAGPFDLDSAPDAGGLFLGDYHGLSSQDRHFLAVLALPGADPANRADVFAFRHEVGAAGP